MTTIYNKCQIDKTNKNITQIDNRNLYTNNVFCFLVGNCNAIK